MMQKAGVFHTTYAETYLLVQLKKQLERMDAFFFPSRPLGVSDATEKACLIYGPERVPVLVCLLCRNIDTRGRV